MFGRILYFPLILGIFVFIDTISIGISYSGQDLNESFLRAVTLKNYKLMQEFLIKGADINATYHKGKFTALSSAASSGDIALVNFLLKHGANAEGNLNFPNSPIYLAISGNHLKIISRLLDEGIDPNYAWAGKNGGTLLISAVQFDHIDVVRLLVDRGADVNFTGNGDHSPLYRSIIYDRFDIFSFLLEKGAKLSEKDKSALKELKWFDIKENTKYIEKLNET